MEPIRYIPYSSSSEERVQNIWRVIIFCHEEWGEGDHTINNRVRQGNLKFIVNDHGEYESNCLNNHNVGYLGN